MLTGEFGVLVVERLRCAAGNRVSVGKLLEVTTKLTLRYPGARNGATWGHGPRTQWGFRVKWSSGNFTGAPITHY